MPKAVAHAAYATYAGSGAVTDYVEFPGRSHLLVAGPRWEEVAGEIARWLERVLPPVAVTQ